LKRNRLVIPLQDYERIFRVAYSVLEGMNARTGRACIFFSMVGAAILYNFYKKRAIIAAGAAFYRVDDESSTVVAYGHLDGEHASSSHAAFHSWLQCDDVLIDFMAPVFANSLRLDGHTVAPPAKMFQRPLVAMAAAPTALKREGDFYVLPDVQLTNELFAERKVSETDLVDVCVHWYKRPPKPIDPVLTIMDDLRQRTDLTLQGPRVEAAW
jgi:hypothetical protein